LEKNREGNDKNDLSAGRLWGLRYKATTTKEEKIQNVARGETWLVRAITMRETHSKQARGLQGTITRCRGGPLSTCGMGGGAKKKRKKLVLASRANF